MNSTRLIAALALMALSGCTTKDVSNDARVKPTDSALVYGERPAAQQSIDDAVCDESSTSHEPSQPAVNQPVEAEKCMDAPSEVSVSERRAVKKEALGAQSARAELKCVSPSRAQSMSPQSYASMAPATTGCAMYNNVPDINTEQYNHISENGFKTVRNDPLSTFSIDVDKASYGNIRRFLTANTLPPKDAVRIEEMINYFPYDYPQPNDGHPFSITTEIGTCPWNGEHKLVHIGLQGKKIATESMPPSNLVFLLDVSGSMNSPDKLPLLKMAMKLLVEKLRSQDRVAIAVYAGSAGLVLPSTAGTNRGEIISAIERLEAGGSTAGSEGIELAYATARSAFIKGGNNRVILATDGDFNVGPSSDEELVRIIEEKRKAGIYLTVLGFGTGNYKDSKMEQLADKGNGNYAYIDNLLEAKKVLVSEMGGTLLTIAKDVKIQIEFNPENVSSYRLVGYENRMLADRDFNDDTKDAGELGSGHTVTALYEIVPARAIERYPSIDPLKYQKRTIREERTISDELLTVKFRYKKPDEEQSRLISKVVWANVVDNASENFTFSAAVAGFGMLLRDSDHKGGLTYDRVIAMAREAKGKDRNGYRSECIKLMEQAELLSSRVSYRNDE